MFFLLILEFSDLTRRADHIVNTRKIKGRAKHNPDLYKGSYTLYIKDGRIAYKYVYMKHRQHLFQKKKNGRNQLNIFKPIYMETNHLNLLISLTFPPTFEIASEILFQNNNT